MSPRPSPLLSKTARKWVLWVHVLTSSLWLGAAAAMVLLFAAKGIEFDHPLEVHAFHLCVKLIDDYVIIASCGLSALSGALLAWKTQWGFFRYWWVAVKLVLTLSLLLSGASLLGPWVNELESLARANTDTGIRVLDLPRYILVEYRTSRLGAGQVLLLGFIMYASTLKPWGKRSTSRPAPRGSATARGTAPSNGSKH